MTILYRVEGETRVPHTSPLHWCNFFSDKQRIHPRKMAKRQDLILYIANLHASAIQSGMPLGMIEVQVRLTSLRDWDQEYRVVLDRFFNVRQLGFNISEDNHQISILTPKKISNGAAAASEAATKLKYAPPTRVGEVISKVYVQQQNAKSILAKLSESNRLDLLAPVKWILEHKELNFHFERAGRLQQRDTSVWPVPGVETWPSWLRTDLFGEGIDIDSAYTQFLVSHLRKIYAGKDKLLRYLFPDLLASLENKSEWRATICRSILGVEPTPENIGIVKRLCMSLANGSRISPSILSGARAFSVTSDLVFSTISDVTPTNLLKIGRALQKISKQYATAKKLICSTLLRQSSSRTNQKKIFASYFEWERIARYAIWQACDCHGIMVHDGIDGVPSSYLQNLPELVERLNIRLTHA
jgi:hypothetical protein